MCSRFQGSNKPGPAPPCPAGSPPARWLRAVSVLWRQLAHSLPGCTAGLPFEWGPGPWADLLQEQTGTLRLAGWVAGPHEARTAMCLWLLLEQRMVPPPLSCLPWLRPNQGAGGAVGTTLPPCWGRPDAAAAHSQGRAAERRDHCSLASGAAAIARAAGLFRRNERRRLATRQDFLLGCRCVGRGGELGREQSCESGLILFSASHWVTSCTQGPPVGTAGLARLREAPAKQEEQQRRLQAGEG